MDERVTRLEVEFQYVRRDLDDVKGALGTILAKLSSMPTKDDLARLSQDLWQWRVQWTAISVAAVALIVGGIIGGLAWIKPEPAPAPSIQVIPAPASAPAVQVVPVPAPAPVVIQLPSPALPAPPPAAEPPAPGPLPPSPSPSP